ncbi:hypothetical protein YQE_01603, partial [Dendroctonus ponderosae]
MSRFREWDLSCKVYVGNLGSSASKHEIESAFSKYGPLRNVWVARNPPGFAFVEYEDPRDAEDAVRGLDGTSQFAVDVHITSLMVLDEAKEHDKVYFETKVDNFSMKHPV